MLAASQLNKRNNFWAVVTKAGTTTISLPAICRFSPDQSLSCNIMIKVVGDNIKAVSKAMDLAKQAPVLAICLTAATIALYLMGGFMERRDAHWEKMLETTLTRSDKIADIRIEQCHSVQSEAHQSMDKFSEAMVEQSSTLRELTLAIRMIGFAQPDARFPTVVREQFE